jgi:hypothetical protein
MSTNTLQLILKQSEITEQDLLNEIRTVDEIKCITYLFNDTIKGFLDRNEDYVYNSNKSSSTDCETTIYDLPEDVLELIMKYSRPTLEDKLNIINTVDGLRDFDTKLTRATARVELEYRAKYAEKNKYFKILLDDGKFQMLKFKKYEREDGIGFYTTFDLLFPVTPEFVELVFIKFGKTIEVGSYFYNGHKKNEQKLSPYYKYTVLTVEDIRVINGDYLYV